MKDAVPPVDVAANIRAELGRRRLTYRDLAKKIAGRSELSEATLRKRLVGETKFRADELPAIADALDLPIAQLLGEEARAS